MLRSYFLSLFSFPFYSEICTRRGRRQELMEGVFLLFFPPPASPPFFLTPFPSHSLPLPFPPFPWHPYPFPPILPIPCPSPTSSPPFPLLPSFSVPFSPFTLEVGPLNQLGGPGERCKLPSGVRSGAPAEIEFDAL